MIVEEVIEAYKVNRSVQVPELGLQGANPQQLLVLACKTCFNDNNNNNNNIRCRTILVLTCKICFNDDNNNNNNIRCRTILVLTCKICFNDNNNNNNNIRCRTILVEPTMLPVKCFLQSQTFPSVHSAYMTKEPLLESFVSCE